MFLSSLIIDILRNLLYPDRNPPVQPNVPQENMYQANQFNTATQRRFAFPGTQIAYEMVSRNLGIPYLEQAANQRERNIVMAMYAKGRCLNEGWSVPNLARPLTGLEMVAPNIPGDRFLGAADARKAFVRAGLRYMIDANYAGTYSSGPGGVRPTSHMAAAQAYLNRIPNQELPEWDGVDTAVRYLSGMDNADEITADTYTEGLAQAIAAWLYLLATRPTNQGRSVSTNVYVMTYLGIAKRGTISEGKLTRVNDAVTQETNMVINVTDAEVQAIGTSMAPFIDHTNAEAIMTAMAGEMNGLSLRLSITMLQTAKSGMTSYWCVRNACMLCPTFDWGEASRYIPDDFARYHVAYTTVMNNQYYGFSRDLGDAKHTNYVSLAWLAMKLLIKADAVTYGRLRDYRGFTTRPKHEAELQVLIDRWAPVAAAQPVQGLNGRIALWGGAIGGGV